MPGHRARMDVVHPVADDHVGAALELSHEAWDLSEVVGEIGVGHHHVLAARVSEAREVRAPVAPLRLEHHAGAGLGCELAAAVARAVVDHDHLAWHLARGQGLAGAPDALLNRLGLVQAWDDHRDLDDRLLGKRVSRTLSLDRAHAPSPRLDVYREKRALWPKVAGVGAFVAASEIPQAYRQSSSRRRADAVAYCRVRLSATRSFPWLPLRNVLLCTHCSLR